MSPEKSYKELFLHKTLLSSTHMATKPVELTPTDNMDSSSTIVTLDVDRIARWNVFNRLKVLSVPCRCTSGQPLQVQAESPAALIQIWSVIQLFTQPREALVDHLDRCWKQQVKP